jgi:hypothetical protein
LKDKEEAVNQARTEADTARAAAAQEETQAADKARADQVARDAQVAEAQRALDVARAEAAQSGSSKETQSADLVNARDAIEVWTLKLKQAQDEVEIATKAATHALETKELAKSDEAIAAATELVAAKDAAKQAAIDAMNTATNELQNAKRKLSELSRAVIQVSADSSGDSNNAYLAEVELNVKRAAREQLSFNEDARRQNSLAREAVRDENARAVVAAKEKMLQCAREQLDKVAEGAAQAKAKHDAAVQAKEQAARLIDAIKNAESALGYDADHTNSTNDACPAVVAEKKPFPEEIEPKVAEVVKVQREEKHEHEEEPSEQSSPSAYPSSDRSEQSSPSAYPSSERSEQSSPSAYPSSERSEQSSPRAYPSSERSVSSSKPTPTYASTSPTQEESTEQRTRAPLPTPERVPEEDAAEEEVSEETKTDEMLLEKCSDCATVSSDIALSGYSTETFDGSARDAFVNGMAQTLGVADDEVVITSVTATSTAKTLTGRALLAEGGVLVKFTVLVEDDTTASQVEDNLLAAKTDPAVAETVKANMIDAGLQDVKTIDIPATPTRVTKAAYAAKVVAVKANMERRESAAKKQVASRSEAVKALMDEYKAKIYAFVDDAKVKITAAWDNANDVERVLTVLVLVLALYLLYRILAFACCCCCRRRRDTQDAGSSSSLRRDAAKSSAYGAV